MWGARPGEGDNHRFILCLADLLILDWRSLGTLFNSIAYGFVDINTKLDDLWGYTMWFFLV